jgi:hypothetical protein
VTTIVCDERESLVYTATLQDEAETPIPVGQLTTLTLTLYDATTGTILNSRNAQNILNTNNVTVHATNGLLTWTVQPADLAMVTTNMAQELHIALFSWTWASGTKVGYHEVRFLVANLENVV